MQKLNVGFVGCYQTNFNVGFALKGLKRSIEALERLSNEKNFRLYPVREGIFDQNETAEAKNELERKESRFSPHSK